MSFFHLDTESILSCSQQWLELNRKWGEPVDLDAADGRDVGGRLLLASSTGNLNRTTFDSAKLIDKLKRAKRAARRLHDSLADYDEFTEKISYSTDNSDCWSLKKSFYFIGGSILSKKSVENICQDIDAMFEDLETIRVATSTVRAVAKKRRQRGRQAKTRAKVPAVVEHSACVSGLSFDDTILQSSGTERALSESLARVISYIETLFQMFETESFHC